jgi:hypothetical protein
MKTVDAMNGPMPLALAIALATTLLLGGMLLWLAMHSLLDRGRWSHALGTVVSHGEVGPAEGTGRGYRYPMDVGIEFRGTDGQTWRFVEKLYAADIIPDYNIGAPVPVRYLAADPKATADTHSSGTLAGAIFLLVVGLLLVLPAAFYAAIQFGLLEKFLGHNPLDYIALILCSSVGIAVFLVPALAVGIARAQFLSTAVPAQLRVVGIQKDEIVLSHQESDSGSAQSSTQAEYLQFELMAPNRPVLKTAEKLLSTQSSPPYAVGEVLQVLYAPDDPGNWIRDRWTSRWLAAVALAAAGLLLLAGGWLLQPGAKELADEQALQQAFDRLGSARGADEQRKAADEVFKAAARTEPAQAHEVFVDSFAPDKLKAVLALWKPMRDAAASYSLKATDPLPERWPAQPGDGIVYYVYPRSQVQPGVENRGEPIAQVTASPAGSPVVKPLAQSLVPLGAAVTPGAAEAGSNEAAQVARAWVARQRTFASLSPGAREALKAWYCGNSGAGDPVLAKMMRLHHADFLAWLSCPP